MPHGRSPGETHEEASPRAKTVVVVGAGLSGLSAAMHCAGAGYRVTLVEPLDVPGGRNGTLTQVGLRFDTGPVVFTMSLVGAELAGLVAVGKP
jgi:phytoene dehydrogenase-like protein